MSSLSTSAAGNKRRRVDNDDSDDEDDGGFMKILNWEYGAEYDHSKTNFKKVLESLPRPTMQCEFPIMFSSQLDSKLSDPSYYFKISLYHIDIDDTIEVEQTVRTTSSVSKEQFGSVKITTLRYLYHEGTVASKKEEDMKTKYNQWREERYYPTACKDYLLGCAAKTKRVVDYYSAPNNYPGTPRFAAIMVERCKRNSQERETTFCTLQVLVPSRLAISALSSEYSQKNWCVKTFEKLKTGLMDFGIDSRDFVQGEVVADDGQVDLRF